MSSSFANRTLRWPATSGMAPPQSAVRKPGATSPRSRSNQSLLRELTTGALQRKLTVNQPGDKFEQEADRVADAVMRMPDAATSAPSPAVASRNSHLGLQQCSCGASSSLGGECEECKSQSLELQRSSSTAESGTAAPPIVHEVLGSPGQPLDRATRNFMEPRFGRDFSGVRIHTEAEAAESARAVNALAYTVGKDVVFARDQFSPQSQAGRSLLAHELVHTVQQNDSSSPRVPGAGPLRRRIGDGHDLTSPRFRRDLVLEGVYDNEGLLMKGSRGAAVKKLQLALIDSGFLLPKFGVDGIFGPETEAAVQGFQHASGLASADVDGIVGPTTMGWLDQRFSAGPTPAGTTPGATTGCPAIKTLAVDLVSMDGSTRNPPTELDRASTILDQCCVHLTLGTGASEPPARTRALLGGGTVLTKTTACGRPTAQELALFSGVSADLGLSSRIRAIYVQSTSPAVPAYDFPPFCATGAAAPLLGMAVVTNGASVRGLAHEIAHILLNSGAHPANPLNLMSAPAAPPGEQLDAAQCATILAAV
jgi:hypothetical protein